MWNYYLSLHNMADFAAGGVYHEEGEFVSIFSFFHS